MWLRYTEEKEIPRTEQVKKLSAYWIHNIDDIHGIEISLVENRNNGKEKDLEPVILPSVDEGKRLQEIKMAGTRRVIT